MKCQSENCRLKSPEHVQSIGINQCVCRFWNKSMPKGTWKVIVDAERNRCTLEKPANQLPWFEGGGGSNSMKRVPKTTPNQRNSYQNGTSNRCKIEPAPRRHSGSVSGCQNVSTQSREECFWDPFWDQFFQKLKNTIRKGIHKSMKKNNEFRSQTGSQNEVKIV